MNTNKPPTKYRKWLYLRRGVQIAFLGLFFLLFLKAEYSNQDTLAWPVDLFFRFDPLALAVTLLTFSPLVKGLLWSLVFLGLTLVLGRFFCGWVCPLGTTLDGFRRLLFTPRPDRGLANRWRRFKYYFLFFLLAGAPFSVNLAGLFDPLSLLYRTLAIAFYPAFGYGVEKTGLVLYRLGKPVTYLSEPIYQFFKVTVLPFKPLVYLLPIFTLALFALVVALERVDRRFWCRALCPLGALYGLFARFALLRRRPTVLCKDCGDCVAVCKMGAFGGEDRGLETPAFSPELPLPTPQFGSTGFQPVQHRQDACAPGETAGEGGLEGSTGVLRPPGPPLKSPFERPRHLTAECQLCLRCQEACGQGRVAFKFGMKVPRAPIDLGRRQVLTSLAVGIAVAPLVRLGSLARRPEEHLIRPPGAQQEGEFLARCLRCGQCLKVCLTNGLQPLLWEAGLEGLYTPRLVPRMGYCAHSCTLCGQVCPTGAIPRLDLKVKEATVLGTAFVNRHRCIPYTEGADCLVCEEHCPVSPKAITFNMAEVPDLEGKKILVKLPVVQPDRCIGCGHCEYVCPVGGEAAIRVKRSLRVEM